MRSSGLGPMLAAACVIAAALTAPSPALPQSEPYPNRPVRLVVDSAAGSANDATGRILADKLGKLWNQQIVIFNQPGAGGSLSARTAATSPPDGYTLYMPASSTFLALAGAPGVAPNLPVELPRDFAAIGFVLQQPIFIGASHAAGITSVKQLVALAKEKPNAISYAATGRGRLTHLTMELLQAQAGVKLQLVPYAGGPAQAMNDVIAGRVALTLDAYGGIAGAVRGNAIRGLANTAPRRLPGLEDMETVAETLPGFSVGAWNVLLAPNGTPEAILRKVNADLNVALDDADLKEKFAANGAFIQKMTPAETVAFVAAEQTKWRPILERVAAEEPK